MDNQKFWEEYIKPFLIRYLEQKNEELKSKGLIPTIELLLEELKNETNI